MTTSFEFMGSQIRIESDDAIALKNLLYRSSSFCRYASLQYCTDVQFDLGEDACDLADCFGAAYREILCKK